MKISPKFFHWNENEKEMTEIMTGIEDIKIQFAHTAHCPSCCGAIIQAYFNNFAL